MSNCESCNKECDGSARSKKSKADYSIEWSTPKDLFDALDAEFHFTCDVAATSENALVKKYYTKEDDALSKEWKGVCWLNPPWTGRGDMKKWVQKAYESKALVVALLPLNKATGWWRDFCTKVEVREVRGEFIGCNLKKTKDGAIVIFPPNFNVLPLMRRNMHDCPRALNVLLPGF